MELFLKMCHNCSTMENRSHPEPKGLILQPSVKNPFSSGPVWFCPETNSTMELADMLSRKAQQTTRSSFSDKTNDTAEVVVRAAYQRKGRGRAPGRAWQGEAGQNLFTTIVLKRKRIPGLLQTLPLRAGLGVLQLLESRKPAKTPASEIQVKWPNDVLISGRKVCGILCEGRGDRVLIGIGLNVNQRSFPPLKRKASSLILEFGKTYSVENLFQELLYSVQDALMNTEWRSRLDKHLYGRGRIAEYIPGDAYAHEILQGLVIGVAEDGALRMGKPSKVKSPWGKPPDGKYSAGKGTGTLRASAAAFDAGTPIQEEEERLLYAGELVRIIEDEYIT